MFQQLDLLSEIQELCMDYFAEDDKSVLEEIKNKVNGDVIIISRVFAMLNSMYKNNWQWRKKINDVIDLFVDDVKGYLEKSKSIADRVNGFLEYYPLYLIKLVNMYSKYEYVLTFLKYGGHYTKKVKPLYISSYMRAKINDIINHVCYACTIQHDIKSWNDYVRIVNLPMLEKECEMLHEKYVKCYNDKDYNIEKLEYNEMIKRFLTLVLNIREYLQSLEMIYNSAIVLLESVDYGEWDVYATFKNSREILKHLVEKGVLTHVYILGNLGLTDIVILNMFKHNYTEMRQLRLAEWNESRCDMFSLLYSDRVYKMIPKAIRNINSVCNDIDEWNNLFPNPLIDIIKKDECGEFISYITECNIKCDDKLNIMFKSMNNYLDLAAYYGAYSIFKYVFENGKFNDVKISNVFIGNNPEIIHYIEDNNIPHRKLYMAEECMKLFRPEIAEYLHNNGYDNYCSLNTIMDAFNYTALKEELNKTMFTEDAYKKILKHLEDVIGCKA